jgi:hypothetical protein
MVPPGSVGDCLAWASTVKDDLGLREVSIWKTRLCVKAHTSLNDVEKTQGQKLRNLFPGFGGIGRERVVRGMFSNGI